MCKTHMGGLYARRTSFPFRELPGIEVSLSRDMVLKIQPSEDDTNVGDSEPLEMSHGRLRIGESPRCDPLSVKSDFEERRLSGELRTFYRRRTRSWSAEDERGHRCYFKRGNRH